MKYTEPRPIITPINKGFGIENLDYEEIKKMVRFNAEQESIDPRLVKNIGFTMSRHLSQCLEHAYQMSYKSKSKAHILRTALYVFLSLELKEQEELLTWFDNGYRKSK